ncbi:hypothetical protein ACFPIJ_40800 [Dactylosporangium cerinum]|uniref:Uncharacterized protein n=1 Tax=Dactylosporangium cerinum TaxID=1434730 RepID=A0ABV9W658_9ACTN
MNTREHPSWCVGEAAGCIDEPGHRSAELVVPGDGVSGVGATAALWCSANGCEFVELTLTQFPERNNVPAAPRYVTTSAQLSQHRLTKVVLSSVALLDNDADDPLDFLPHDFTIDQAELLHAALGQLLTYARHTRTAVPVPA